MAIAVSSPVERGLDFAAAAVPAVAGAYAGASLGPLLGYSAFPLAAVAASIIFAVSLKFMRAIGKDETHFAIRSFAPVHETEKGEFSELLLETPMDEDELLLNVDAEMPPLVLDQPYVDGQVDDLAELLLNDPIVPLASHSRVVQLFAIQPMPTAGQLADRIDRHLGHAPAIPMVDATDALHEALAELRRSLRRA